MAYVEIETPDGVRQVHLDRPRMSIGRLSYNDVALPYSQISRQHAELRLVDGVWWIADLHSTNGLHIGAERVGEQRLTDGEVVALAPDVHLRFVAERGAPLASSAPAPSGPAADTSNTRPWLLNQASSASSQAATRPTAGPSPQAPQPSRAAPPARPASMPASRPISSPAARAFGPRSPFADDEERYIPPGMAAQGAPPAGAALLPPIPGAGAFGAAPTVPAAGPLAGATSPTGQSATASYGYGASVEAGAGGPGLYDPYQRGMSGPAPTLLHVCQTCGQLTAPDAVYCQNCHHPIAYECPNCRLSLLPIQDRCPRCQTPNPASVRRAHRNPGG